MYKVIEQYAECAYIAPVCVIFEIAPEGVLCMSPEIPDWEENDDVL